MKNPSTESVNLLHESVYKKPKILFHTFFGELNEELQILEFIVKTSDPLYHQYFSNWRSEIDRKILNLKDNAKKEFQIFKLVEEGKPFPKGRKKFKLTEKKALAIIVEHHKLKLFHGYVLWEINQMILSNIISRFEEFLKKVIRLMYEKDTKILQYSNVQITMSEVMEAKNIEGIKQEGIEKIIDNVINEGIKEYSKFFQKHKLQLEKDKNWKKFAEIFHRRNVWIHNDGIPDDSYRMKTGSKTKQKLWVTYNYLKIAFRVTDEISHVITDHFEKKYTPKTAKSIHSAK